MAMLNESDWEWPNMSDFVRTPRTWAQMRGYHLPLPESRLRSVASRLRQMRERKVRR